MLICMPFSSATEGRIPLSVRVERIQTPSDPTSSKPPHHGPAPPRSRRRHASLLPLRRSRRWLHPPRVPRVRSPTPARLFLKGWPPLPRLPRSRRVLPPPPRPSCVGFKRSGACPLFMAAKARHSQRSRAPKARAKIRRARVRTAARKILAPRPQSLCLHRWDSHITLRLSRFVKIREPVGILGQPFYAALL